MFKYEERDNANIRCGIIGLYTGYTLIEKGVSGTDIKILAEYMPGDESIDYTSPYAGGNFSCITGDDPATMRYDKFTYTNLERLQRKLGGRTCGVDRLKSTEYWDLRPSPQKTLSLRSYLDEYKEISAECLPENVQFGITFLSWNFNCPKFLLNLKVHLEGKGVVFERRKLSHVTQAFGPGVKTVFNCTGIGARKLGGVQDINVYPTRGQVVVIKAPHIQENVMRWGDDYATYIIKRPYSNDQLILGGFMQKDDWTPSTFADQTADILARTTKLFPKILEQNALGHSVGDLEITRVVAGLRPSRHGGTRIEKEDVEGKTMIHNYGAGGYGYQAGLGMARHSVDLALGGAKL